MSDLISRQAAIAKVNEYASIWMEYTEGMSKDEIAQAALDSAKQTMIRILSELPSAQTERCEYYALCRHGRDENKLRARLGFCEYCNEDSDGYVRPIEKNSHAWLVRHGKTMKLRVSFKGEHRDCDIKFCPMCGRRLTDG